MAAPSSRSLRLRPPGPADEASVRAAQRELAGEDFEFAFGLGEDVPFADFLDRLAAERIGRDLPSGHVPATWLVADVDGEIVGRASIRFELNDYLAEFGGHIGYGVRPAHRRRGYAGEILRQSLIVARAAGIGEVLVTCDDTNLGSATVIEAVGGVLASVRDMPDGSRLRRYWIR